MIGIMLGNILYFYDTKYYNKYKFIHNIMLGRHPQNIKYVPIFPKSTKITKYEK